MIYRKTATTNIVEFFFFFEFVSFSLHQQFKVKDRPTE